MTIEEYAKQVSDRLNKVNTYKDALPIIDQAESTLINSNLSAADQNIFWNALQEKYYSNTVIRKQDSTAVNSVIEAIQSAIQNKAKSA